MLSAPQELADNSTLTPCEMIKSPAWKRFVGSSPLVSQNKEVLASIIDLPFGVSAMHVTVVGQSTVGFMASPDGYINKVRRLVTSRILLQA